MTTAKKKLCLQTQFNLKNNNNNNNHFIQVSTVVSTEWNLDVMVFEERGTGSTRRKTSRSKDENQQQTQPTYDTGTGNRTRATLVGGEFTHHWAIPASLTPNQAKL